MSKLEECLICSVLKCDLKIGFPLVFVCKLSNIHEFVFNCVATSVSSVISASMFALKFFRIYFCIFDLLITSAMFSHVFLMPFLHLLNCRL